jgi:hypothetical protein
MITPVTEDGKTCTGRNPRAGHRRIALGGTLLGLGMLVSACVQAPPAPVAGVEPLVITQQSNSELQDYLKAIYPVWRGAFAISDNGKDSYYFYCPDAACTVALFGGIATAQCESLSGQHCSLLYVNSAPRVAYTVSTAKSVDGRHGSRRGWPVDEVMFRN